MRPVDDAWRGDAGVQRAAFDDSRPTLAARVFRHLGSGRTWNKKMAWLGSQLWARSPRGRFLEIGAGEGTGHETVDRYPVGRVATDPAASALRRLRGRGAGSGALGWVAAFAEELPFRDASFDGVFGIDILHHVADPSRVFAELARVLRPGGHLAFVEPNPWYPVNLVVALSPIERGIYRITVPNLRRWAATAGLGAPRIGAVNIFFPSLPSRLGPVYERLEHLLGGVPGATRLATARTILVSRPA